jgi:hypothetical protein
MLSSGLVFWPVCLAGVALVGAAVLAPELARRAAIERQVAAMQAEVDGLARSRDHLTAMRQGLEDDPAYTEVVLRRELGLTKPGELHLPQPADLAAVRKTAPPAAPVSLLPPEAEEWVQRLSGTWLGTASLVAGATLLGVGLLLSMPDRPRPEAVA